jgi:hypothetical protein
MSDVGNDEGVAVTAPDPTKPATSSQAAAASFNRSPGSPFGSNWRPQGQSIPNASPGASSIWSMVRGRRCYSLCQLLHHNSINRCVEPDRCCWVYWVGSSLDCARNGKCAESRGRVRRRLKPSAGQGRRASCSRTSHKRRCKLVWSRLR